MPVEALYSPPWLVSSLTTFNSAVAAMVGVFSNHLRCHAEPVEALCAVMLSLSKHCRSAVMLSLVNFTAFDKLRLTLFFNFKGLKF
jgi:hypothetical protein